MDPQEPEAMESRKRPREEGNDDPQGFWKAQLEVEGD